MEKPQISEPQFSFLYGVVYEGGEPGPAGVFAEVFSHKLNKSQAEGLADIAVDTDDIDAAGQIVYHLYDKLGDENIKTLLKLLAESDRWSNILADRLGNKLTHQQKELLR
jgi:hypothetical protein